VTIDDVVFIMDGYTIDLDDQYRSMHAQSVVEDGLRIFHGNNNDVRAAGNKVNKMKPWGYRTAGATGSCASRTGRLRSQADPRLG
jgi:hypothetical protein